MVQALRKKGQCEQCDKTDLNVTLQYGNMYFCDDCWRIESEAVANNKVAATTPVITEKTDGSVLSLIDESQRLDATVDVASDIFNNETKSIVDLKSAIDADASITNKPYKLAEIVKSRFTTYQERIFELEKEKMELVSRQRADQVYMNNMANQLRAEEREKLHIADMNYTPKPVKVPHVRKITTSQTEKPSKKATNAEFKAASQELGLPEFTLRAFTIQNGGDLAETVKKLKASIEAAKRASN